MDRLKDRGLPSDALPHLRILETLHWVWLQGDERLYMFGSSCQNLQSRSRTSTLRAATAWFLMLMIIALLEPAT